MARRQLRGIQLNEPASEQAELPRRPVLMAIDFDRTYTADRRLWQAFILGAVRSGHRVICVTDRRDSGENRRIIAASFGQIFQHLAAVVYCNNQPKRRAAELWGHRVDIWIDDVPEIIAADSVTAVQELRAQFPMEETLPLV